MDAPPLLQGGKEEGEELAVSRLEAGKLVAHGALQAKEGRGDEVPEALEGAGLRKGDEGEVLRRGAGEDEEEEGLLVGEGELLPGPLVAVAPRGLVPAERRVQAVPEVLEVALGLALRDLEALRHLRDPDAAPLPDAPVDEGYSF